MLEETETQASNVGQSDMLIIKRVIKHANNTRREYPQK